MTRLGTAHRGVLADLRSGELDRADLVNADGPAGPPNLEEP
ncbi:hypothetical protein [Streptomyces sp. NPDC059063]